MMKPFFKISLFASAIFPAMLLLLLGAQLTLADLAWATDTRATQFEKTQIVTIERQVIKSLMSRPKLFKRTPEPFELPTSFSRRKTPGATGDVTFNETSCSCNGWVSCGILKWYCGGTFSGHGDKGNSP